MSLTLAAKIQWSGADRQGLRWAFVHEIGNQILDIRRMFPDQQVWANTLRHKEGFAIHHDAVAFSGEDLDFNGSTLDESLERIRIIYDFHRNKGWNGIGYHYLIDPEGRIFLAGNEDTHRAHVSGGYINGVSHNDRLVGICFLGNYADREGPDGRPIAPLLDRPTPQAIKSMIWLTQEVTDTLNRPMTIHPHKYYQNKACPGTWANVDAWDGLVLEPKEVQIDPSLPRDLYPIDGEDWQRIIQAVQAGRLKPHDFENGKPRYILTL